MLSSPLPQPGILARFTSGAISNTRVPARLHRASGPLSSKLDQMTDLEPSPEQEPRQEQRSGAAIRDRRPRKMPVSKSATAGPGGIGSSHKNTRAAMQHIHGVDVGKKGAMAVHGGRKNLTVPEEDLGIMALDSKDIDAGGPSDDDLSEDFLHHLSERNRGIGDHGKIEVQAADSESMAMERVLAEGGYEYEAEGEEEEGEYEEGYEYEAYLVTEPDEEGIGAAAAPAPPPLFSEADFPTISASPPTAAPSGPGGRAFSEVAKPYAEVEEAEGQPGPAGIAARAAGEAGGAGAEAGGPPGASTAREEAESKEGPEGPEEETEASDKAELEAAARRFGEGYGAPRGDSGMGLIQEAMGYEPETPQEMQGGRTPAPSLATEPAAPQRGAHGDLKAALKGMRLDQPKPQPQQTPPARKLPYSANAAPFTPPAAAVTGNPGHTGNPNPNPNPNRGSEPAEVEEPIGDEYDLQHFASAAGAAAPEAGPEPEATRMESLGGAAELASHGVVGDHGQVVMGGEGGAAMSDVPRPTTEVLQRELDRLVGGIEVPKGTTTAHVELPTAPPPVPSIPAPGADTPKLLASGELDEIALALTEEEVQRARELASHPTPITAVVVGSHERQGVIEERASPLQSMSEELGGGAEESHILFDPTLAPKMLGAPRPGEALPDTGAFEARTGEEGEMAAPGGAGAAPTPITAVATGKEHERRGAVEEVGFPAGAY